MNASNRYTIAMTDIEPRNWNYYTMYIRSVIHGVMQEMGYSEEQIGQYFKMSGDTTITKTHGRKSVGGINRMVMDAQYFGKKLEKEAKANLPYHTFEKRKEENPNGVVEKIKIICMGHEADLKASLEQELSSYNLEIEIVDILRDKKDLQFKREADANVVKENNQIIIKEFYPMNLLQKLSMQKESVEDWRQLVESIYIDWNYDGQTMRPTICDIPAKDELVSGIYKIPASVGKIKIKITDLLSESLELEV